MSFSGSVVPMVACFLQLAATVAFGATAQPPCAPDQQSCSAPPPSLAEQGTWLLQRHSERVRATVASDTAADAAQQPRAPLPAQPKLFREDYMERLWAFEAEHRASGAQGGRDAPPPQAGATPGAQLLDSGCSDTPDWQNWAGWTCDIYVSFGICKDAGGTPGNEWAFGEWLGYPEKHCCACGKGTQATCSVHGCPYGWNSRADEASSTTVSDETCCEKTCAAYVMDPSCPDGYEPDWDRSSSTLLSDEVCCKVTTTTTTPPPFEGVGKAQYVRFLPQTWGGSIAMRAAVLVGDDLEVVDPPEESRNYSSVKPLNNQYVQEGTDGHPGSNYGRSMAEQCCGHAWSPKVNAVGEWMQINLPRNMDVRGVVVIGKPKRGCPHKQPEFVKSLTIETATTEDPTTFEARDNGKVFNTIESADKSTVKIVFDEAASTSSPLPNEYLLSSSTDAPSTTQATVVAPSTTKATVVEEICPALLYTDKILCDDGTAVESGECCPDNGFCPSSCVGSASKSTNWAGEATCSCTGCGMERKLVMSDADAMLQAHNYLRCLHGHPALQWDDAVASNAQHPADQSCDTGALAHSDSYDMSPSAGENLAMGLAAPERAAAAWYNELMDPGYDAGVWGSAAVEAGVGHYTALMWKASKKLGCASCASEQSGGKTVWACQYAEEAPNFGGQSDWLENVPQSDELVETPETCCAQIYG